MSDMLRFVHISDTHIGTGPDYLLYGHNTFNSLKKLVNYINTDLPFAPDFILHTGDVAYDPDPAAYQFVQKTLEQLKYPTYYVRGNHDDPDAMRHTLPNLPAGTGRIDYTFEKKGFQFIVLDSFGLVQPAGHLETYQLEWLKITCENSTARSLVIVLHHLPVKTGNAWLDWGMFIDNHDALFQVLAPFASRIRGLFFGHIHTPSTTMRAGIMCSSASSAFSQFIFPSKSNTDPIITAPGGFSLVTLSHEQTWILHHELV